MGRPASRRNHFPDEVTLPGFRAATSAYYEQVDALCHRLLPLYAVAAGMAPGSTTALVFEVADPGKNAVAFEFKFR